MLLGTYLMFEAHTYRGFYAWVSEWQIAAFGSYAPLFSFLFPLGIGFLPVFLLLKVFGAGREGQADRTVNLRLANAIKIRNRVRSVLAIVMGLFLVAMLFVFFVLPDKNDQIATVAVTENPSDQLREGSTRLVGGEIGTVFSFGQSWILGEHRKIYAVYQVPGSEGKNAAFFIDLGPVGKNEIAELRQRTTWSGLLVKGGLPGTTTLMLSAAGIKINEPYFTLYPDRRALQASYFVQLGQMAMLALFLAIVGYLYDRRVRQFQMDDTTLTAYKA